MLGKSLNFRHLYYFWVVAKEGGVSRAAERLGIAVQTVSMQIAQLEKSVGKALLAPQGRRLVLTEAGRLALGYADRIFLLSEQMQEALSEDDVNRSMRLTVGLSDSLPKLIAFRLLEPAMHLSRPVRMECYDGRFESLLADLALHKLDVVLTDRPVMTGTSMRVSSYSLGDSQTLLFGSEALAGRYRDNFPDSLNGAPLLLPTRNNAIRARLDQWLETHGLRPYIVGEFEDSALLKTFGRNGLGLFPAPEALADDILAQFNAVPIGEMTEVREQYFAISTELKIQHPAIEAILTASRQGVFHSA